MRSPEAAHGPVEGLLALHGSQTCLIVGGARIVTMTEPAEAVGVRLKSSAIDPDDLSAAVSRNLVV